MSEPAVARPRLLLVEDDSELGPLLTEALEEAYQVVLAVDSASALTAVTGGLFEVCVIDRRLPDGDGLDLVDRLRRDGVDTPILVLTALGTLQDRVRGLDTGANDYLVKPFELDELFARLRAIRRVYGGEGPLIRIGSWEFYPHSRAIYSPYDGRSILTEREAALLQLLASQPGRTFSRQQILSQVFGGGDGPGVVDTYVHYLRRKTDRDIVTTVRGRGYRLGQL